MTWRKREIMEMAREVDVVTQVLLDRKATQKMEHDVFVLFLERFANLVREDALAQPAPAQEPVAWPCVIAEADFERNTVTLEMQCSDYEVRAGQHWLYTTPPAAPVQEGRDWSLLEATQESLREHMAEIQRLSALVRAQQITIDKLEAESVQEPYTYASKQATMCACCGEHKHTPLRIDAMDGYVCLTCIDQKLGSLLGEFGYPPQRTWVGLTDWEIIQAKAAIKGTLDVQFVQFAQAIEAKLRSKNEHRG